jgi:hypothetical protein
MALIRVSVQWKQRVHLEATHEIVSTESSFIQFVGGVRVHRRRFRRFACVSHALVLCVIVVGVDFGIVGSTVLSEFQIEQSELIIRVAEIVIFISQAIIIVESIKILVALDRPPIIIEFVFIGGRRFGRTEETVRRPSMLFGILLESESTDR